MAVRMALLAHHYRSDWEWTDVVLAEAAARLARWRSAVTRAEAAFPPTITPAESNLSPAESNLSPAEAKFSPAGAEFGAPGATPASMADEVLAGVRARLRDDLDAPGALLIVDRWADSLLARAPTRITWPDVSGARLVRETVDALLGVIL
jgi:L-cysteine:1D-myo-inositol 2-amino-2-deoxy-alpha-D-glucopyranoside ligase